MGSEQDEKAVSGTICAAPALTIRKRKASVPAFGTQWLNANCLHRSCSYYSVPELNTLLDTCPRVAAATSPQCQPTTRTKYNNLERLEQRLLACFTLKNRHCPYCFGQSCGFTFGFTSWCLRKDITFESLFQQLRGDCSLWSRSNVWNFSMSLRLIFLIGLLPMHSNK